MSAWSVLWRAVAAGVGLLFVRSALYRRHWGHGRLLASAISAGLGGLLCWPLWRDVAAARPWLAGVGVLALLPWRRAAVAVLERRMRRGLEALAREWGAEIEEGPGEGLLTVRRPEGEGRRAAWAGNVLTRVRSLHPGVSTRAVHRMMAFVVRLESEPRLRCSLSKGWSSPAYHEREWREHVVMQGEHFRLAMGGVLADEGRETGGSADELTVRPAADDDRFGAFGGRATDDAEAFTAVFRGDLLEELFACAFRGPQFECNVTPTSVNVYTICLGEEGQRRTMAFLDRLADAVDPGRVPPSG